MQTQRQFWEGFQQYNVVNFVVSSCIVAVLVLHFADVTPSAKVGEVHAQPVVLSQCVYPISLNLPFTGQRCIPGDASQSEQNTDMAYKMSITANAPVVSAAPNGAKRLARQTRPAIHFVPQKRTTPFKPLLSASHSSLDVAPLSASTLQGSADNIFPYGQCTWWANQRYHQLHGIFVPWRSNANASQWVARATEFHWHVSDSPKVGSIMVLQPYVDGAYGFGHVGVVSQILNNGRVIANSMNWGRYPNSVTQTTYDLGPGVSFISAE